MNLKVTIYLFIAGCVLVLLALLLKYYEIVENYTLVFVGITIESLSILLYAYQKIKKNG
ncbi:hypothetical protein [Polaribacter pacificus]|uniref:hypothetical protein n=1 Tax=Polaribacter pacificus TaxID=1775173 RepID=UPI00166CA8CA|nr:hypothetical protein [Polaribacter pacificus]